MPVRCQDCNSHFLLDAGTVARGVSCPDCGGSKLERDQPSPTHSDGELRNMVDPATQLDQGGNPLQEGVWAGVDGGWQPAYRRDETLAKTARPQGKETVSSHDPQFYIPMEPYMPWTHEVPKEGSAKESFAFLAPLALAGGRMLLGRALPALMGMAVRGLGNHAQAPQQEPMGADPARATQMIASEHTAVGVNAPVETPGSIPDMVEDHDPEAVDQQEFNDQDMNPAFNNPNLDDADAGLSQSMGEDGMHQKIEFRHDGDGVGHAEMLLPLILEYINSDKSALENPQLKALHDQLESEIPDYLNHADENDPSVQELLEALKRPHEGRTAAPVYMTTPMNPNQMQMGPQQMSMPGTHQNPIQPGGMSVQGRCANCGSVTNADGSCPQCGASPGANQQGNLEQPGQPGQKLQTPGIMPSPYAKTAADHQGPITPQQKEVFAEYLIQQGRQDEVAAMMANPSIYADEWATFLNRQTQPPEVDPAEQAPQPAMDPSQMGQMPVPGMQMPQPTASATDPNARVLEVIGELEAQGYTPEQAFQMASQQVREEFGMNRPVGPKPFGPFRSKTADAQSMRRCPKCQSATTSPLNEEGQMRCHRCGNVYDTGAVKEKISRNWKVVSFQDTLNDAPNPVAAPAADATAPGDREQQADSTLTWQDNSGQPLQVGQIYEMHNPGYPIPDVVKIQAVKPDSITVTMEGEYNAPSDPTDANGPNYTHEIDRSELETEGLTFNPVQTGEGEMEQSQDQAQQDGVGQTVNTEPVEQPHDDFPVHAKTVPTDHCPKCQYTHVTSNYISPEAVQYECFRCSNRWVVADEDKGSESLSPESRTWLNEDSGSHNEIGFDPRALAMASAGGSRNIRDIASRDPRNALVSERLNAAKAERTAGAKYSPREQRQFIDEDGLARNADLLNLEGTHYVASGFDNSKAHPDRVNDNYLGLGL